MSSSRIINISFLCIVLAACGGGGGSTATVAGGIPQQGTAIPTSPSSTDTGVTPASIGSSAPPPASSTPANSGTTTQPATADATRASFNRPLGIAVDGNGSLYVADSFNFTIRRITRTGVVTTLAGSPGNSGSTDGTGAAARFSFPKNVALDGSGNVFVVDGDAVRKVTSAGVVTTLAGAAGMKGDADGTGAAARFNGPWGIAVDTAGNLYVTDTDNYLVRKVTQAGVVTTFAGTRGMRGTADGTRASATLIGPRGIGIDGANNLYISDWLGPPSPMIPEGSSFIRKIAANGEVSTLAGNFGSETAPAQFRDIWAVTADAAGNVLFADHQAIRKLTPARTLSTVASSNTQFDALQGITVDGSGTLFVTDTYTVDKVTPAGEISVVAGKSGEMGSADTQ